MRSIPWLTAVILAALHWTANAQALVTERTLAVTKVMLRDDGANPHTVQHSLNKAYTALTYRTASGEYGKRAAAGFPASAGPLHLDKITTAAGGLPILAGKDLVGAIGVSGSPGSPGGPPGGTVDEKCAQAGIDRITKGLGG